MRGCSWGWKRRVSRDVLEESGIGQTLGGDKQEGKSIVEGSRMKR
jgi:hypothetical protein